MRLRVQLVSSVDSGECKWKDWTTASFEQQRSSDSHRPRWVNEVIDQQHRSETDLTSHFERAIQVATLMETVLHETLRFVLTHLAQCIEERNLQFGCQSSREVSHRIWTLGGRHTRDPCRRRVWLPALLHQLHCRIHQLLTISAARSVFRHHGAPPTVVHNGQHLSIACLQQKHVAAHNNQTVYSWHRWSNHSARHWQWMVIICCHCYDRQTNRRSLSRFMRINCTDDSVSPMMYEFGLLDSLIAKQHCNRRFQCIWHPL